MSLIETLNAAYASDPSPDAVAAALRNPLHSWTRLGSLSEDQIKKLCRERPRVVIGSYSSRTGGWVNSGNYPYQWSWYRTSGDLRDYYIIGTQFYTDRSHPKCP